MIKFFRNWCEELILSSFIIVIIEMLVPDGNIKKYIRVVTGVYMIFVILNPILMNTNNKELENRITNILKVSTSEFNEEEEINKSMKILNEISRNIEEEEANDAREIQK